MKDLIVAGAGPVGRYLLVRWAVAFLGYHLSGQCWFMHALWSAGQAVNDL